MKFRPVPRYRKNSINKNMAFPVELVKNIEKAIEGKDISFHSFVVQACEYVLDQMEEDEEEA